jgi:hypothetical protein
MALSRVKVWAVEILTHTDLNAEFDNIINGALSLISPLTAPLAAGGNDITGLDELALNDAAANASAAGRIRRNGVNPTWHDGTAAYAIITTRGYSGADLLNVDEILFDVGGDATAAGRLRRSLSGPDLTWHDGTAARQLVAVGSTALGAATGTPIPNAIYQQSLVKGWVKFVGATAAISASYNVTSVVRDVAGVWTVTWDRDFTSLHAVISVTVEDPGTVSMAMVTTPGAGSTQISVYKRVDGAAFDPQAVHVVAMGAQ